MRKILAFSASKTLQEKGQNAANISQKHWEKMPNKVSIEMGQTDLQTGGCLCLTRKFPFFFAVIGQPGKLIKK